MTGQGLAQLVGRLADEVARARLAEPGVGDLRRAPAGDPGLPVERTDDGGFKVVGRPAERAVALSDLTNPDALDYAHHRLKRLGVDQALARAGAREGDLVHIGGTPSPTKPTEAEVAPHLAGPTKVVVAKIGTSSVTDDDGRHRVGRHREAVRARWPPCAARAIGWWWSPREPSAPGLPALGLGGADRPRDPVTLQAVSAVGQSRLMRVYDDALAAHGLVAGQVLLAPLDFVDRRQYLQARGTLTRLLELGVVPVVNENDAIADDEIRFGDNDRMAALVAHLVGADPLVLLTDTPGLLTADPRLDAEASLIEEIVEVDHELEAVAGGAGTVRGSGGMSTKVAAAKIASWSGVRTVIAGAARRSVLTDAVAGVAGVGTVVLPGPATSAPASCGSPSPSAPAAPSGWTKEPAGRCCAAAPPCWPRG